MDITYAVQSTFDLAETPIWTPDAVQVDYAIDHGDGTETVTYRNAVASESASSRFLRISAVRMT